MSKKIFISYRRDDPKANAPFIFSILEKAFGEENIFMDVIALKPGKKFPVEIENAILSADVVLVLIGPNWVGIEKNGSKRIDNPDDFLRKEIDIAIEHNKYIIPVLFDGVAMPGLASLPVSIQDLHYCQAITIGTTFTTGGKDLIAVIKAHFRELQRAEFKLFLTRIHIQSSQSLFGSPRKRWFWSRFILLVCANFGLIFVLTYMIALVLTKIDRYMAIDIFTYFVTFSVGIIVMFYTLFWIWVIKPCIEVNLAKYVDGISAAQNLETS